MTQYKLPNTDTTDSMLKPSASLLSITIPIAVPVHWCWDIDTDSSTNESIPTTTTTHHSIHWTATAPQIAMTPPTQPLDEVKATKMRECLMLTTGTITLIMQSWTFACKCYKKCSGKTDAKGMFEPQLMILYQADQTHTLLNFHYLYLKKKNWSHEILETILFILKATKFHWLENQDWEFKCDSYHLGTNPTFIVILDSTSVLNPSYCRRALPCKAVLILISTRGCWICSQVGYI